MGYGRRMPIQQSVDIAAPVESVWKVWNNYEDYPKFMHRVEHAEKVDPKHVHFEARSGASAGLGRQDHREAHVRDDRWTQRGWSHNAGVVTFHKLAPRLTRVELSLDVNPHGSRREARLDGALVAEQHLEPLGAALEIPPVDVRVRARRRPAPRRQVVVALHALVRAPLVAACRVLVHGFRSPPSESSPSIEAFRFEDGLNVPKPVSPTSSGVSNLCGSAIRGGT